MTDSEWEYPPGTVDRWMEVDADEASKIITYGHVVRFVFPTERSLAEGLPGHQFWYSAGRSGRGKEDYLVTGNLAYEMGAYMINAAAAYVDQGEFEPGQDFPPDTLLAGYGVRVVRVKDLEAANMTGTIRYADGCEPVAYQLLWPDLEGRFPGDPGFDDRLEQVMFG